MNSSSSIDANSQMNMHPTRCISARGERHTQLAAVIYYDPVSVHSQRSASSLWASGMQGPQSSRVALHLQRESNHPLLTKEPLCEQQVRHVIALARKGAYNFLRRPHSFRGKEQYLECLLLNKLIVAVQTSFWCTFLQ